jgi:hypothetical protein
VANAGPVSGCLITIHSGMPVMARKIGMEIPMFSQSQAMLSHLQETRGRTVHQRCASASSTAQGDAPGAMGETQGEGEAHNIAPDRADRLSPVANKSDAATNPLVAANTHRQISQVLIDQYQTT